jgi:hypothetical protein
VHAIEAFLQAASREAEATSDSDISPRSLFAAVFDVGFEMPEASGTILPLDAFAAPIVRQAAATGLAGILQGLIQSSTRVGTTLRAAGVDVEVGSGPRTPDDLTLVRRALAPFLEIPLGSDALVELDDGMRLAEPAAQSFVAVRSELRRLEVSLGLLSAHRSTVEQRQDYELTASYVRDLSTFPVAPPGRSLHERGLAVDVAYEGYLQDFRAPAPSPSLQLVRRAMREHGWYQIDAENDPFHFSFGRIG